MARTGRPATPTALKLLRGNPGRRPIAANEPKPPTSDGSCPDWLDEYGRWLWERYAPELVRQGLLTVLDEPLFAAACERWSLYRRTSHALRHGATQKSGANGRVAKPEAGIAKAALDGCKELLAQFGFAPSARSKLGGLAPPKDPLEEHLARRPKLPA